MKKVLYNATKVTKQVFFVVVVVVVIFFVVFFFAK